MQLLNGCHAYVTWCLSRFFICLIAVSELFAHNQSRMGMNVSVSMTEVHII